MMDKDYVFVYGTLRRNGTNHQLMKGAELAAERAWTNGKLFDTGCGYPAIKESPSGTVYGELYLVTAEQLKGLDKLEDYQEGGRNNLYDRKKQTVFHDDSQTEAYVYTIARHNEKMLKTPIPSGDWSAYLNR